MTRDPRRRDRLAPWCVAVALALTLGLAWWGKAVCIDGESGFWALTRYCYSDVTTLWGLRGFDVEAVPYAGPPGTYHTDYTLEYPPGLAFPAWAISLVTDSRGSFFHIHAATFALAAALAVWQLDRALAATRGPTWSASRWRLLGFALSPALVLFGMQNWDLWVVLPVAVGLAAAARGRSFAAAGWFGLGAAVKWWPALLVVVLLAGPWRPSRGSAHPVWRWSERLRARHGIDLRPAVVAGGVWAALQLPALLIGPARWWEAVVFHLRRSPNWDSTAMAVEQVGRHLVGGGLWGEPSARLWTVASLLVLGLVIVHVVARLRRGTLHPADAALATLALFLLVSKIFSPQFVVWILPLAVVARVAWTPVLAVEASNAAVWLLYGPWMAHWQEGAAYWGFLYSAQGMSVVRTLAVGWLVAAALLARAEDAGEQDGDADDGGEQREPPAVEVPGGDEQ